MVTSLQEVKSLLLSIYRPRGKRVKFASEHSSLSSSSSSTSVLVLSILRSISKSLSSYKMILLSTVLMLQGSQRRSSLLTSSLHVWRTHLMSRDNNLVIYLNRFIYNEKRKLTYVFRNFSFLIFPPNTSFLWLQI